MILGGGCLCGHVRYEIAGAPIWQGHCHCRRCQRNSGSAFMSFAVFAEGDVAWLGARPTPYRSSAEINRGFCPRCGSVVSFERPALGRIAVTAGSLDEPDLLAPSEHIFVDEMCAWLRLDDGLPRHGGFSPVLRELGAT